MTWEFIFVALGIWVGMTSTITILFLSWLHKPKIFYRMERFTKLADLAKAISAEQKVDAPFTENQARFIARKVVSKYFEAGQRQMIKKLTYNLYTDRENPGLTICQCSEAEKAVDRLFRWSWPPGRLKMNMLRLKKMI